MHITRNGKHFRRHFAVPLVIHPHMYSVKFSQISNFFFLNITSRTQRLLCAIGKFPRIPILNNFIYHHIAHVHFPVHFPVAGFAGGVIDGTAMKD
jgi:hypothetical protein